MCRVRHKRRRLTIFSIPFVSHLVKPLVHVDALEHLAPDPGQVRQVEFFLRSRPCTGRAHRDRDRACSHRDRPVQTDPVVLLLQHAGCPNCPAVSLHDFILHSNLEASKDRHGSPYHKVREPSVNDDLLDDRLPAKGRWEAQPTEQHSPGLAGFSDFAPRAEDGLRPFCWMRVNRIMGPTAWGLLPPYRPPPWRRRTPARSSPWSSPAGRSWRGPRRLPLSWP